MQSALHYTGTMFYEQALAAIGKLPQIDTRRLRLRKASMHDVGDFYAYASDPEVAATTTWAAHRSLEDTRQALKQIVDSYNSPHSSARWAIEHRDTRAMIGTVGLSNWSPQHSRADLGYALSRAFWGQGMMTEAVQAVMRFGFEQMLLNRIQAMCLPNNIASFRVMEKTGMHYEGLLREHSVIKGVHQSLLLYAVVRTDWLEMQRFLNGSA